MPSEDWQKEDGEFKADPNREYDFACVVENLQERLIPKHNRVVEVGNKWRSAMQKPNCRVDWLP